MSEELLPCPFCGSPARRIKAEDSSWIGCQRCSGSNTNPFKDIAEREWNTRVESAELAQLREKLAAVEEKRDMWLRIAQRLFKERQTMLHGHVYDLPTDDVILEATILEAVIDGTEANETT